MTSKERLACFIREDKTHMTDVERLQLFYVISRNKEMWEVRDKIYDVQSHRLVAGWDELFDGAFAKMLKRAVHMYNPYHEDITTRMLYDSLDFRNRETMYNAQLIFLGVEKIEGMEVFEPNVIYRTDNGFAYYYDERGEFFIASYNTDEEVGRYLSHVINGDGYYDETGKFHWHDMV